MCVRVCSAFKILKHFADIQELLWQVCSWKKKNTSAPCVSFPAVTYNNMADMRTCEAATTPAPVILEYWTYVRQHILKIWADLLNAKNKCGGRAIILCSYWRNSLRHCSTSRKVAGSILKAVIGIFHWLNPSGRTMALGSTHPLTDRSTRNISCEVKAGGAQIFHHLHMPLSRNYGSPNLLQT